MLRRAVVERERLIMSPKGVAPRCRGTKKAGNVAQGCRAALLGNDMGFLCRLRVLDPLIVAWIK